MANTYYDSQLTAEEIEEVLEAINGILTQANNGKVLAISNGKIEARSVQWGGGEAVLEPLSVTENGDYTPEAGVDGFDAVHVAVPNSYTASDEGKVVNNGALIAQTARASQITQNGTYDTTLNNEVTVNVSGGGSAVVQSLSVTQNGTYSPPSGVDGYAPVTVSVSGGGPIEEWDFKESFIGEERGIEISATNVVRDSSGAIFDNTNDYLTIPIRLPVCTIEIDVGAMSLTSGTHRRFVMMNTEQGFIYRSNGKWSLYANGTWATDSDIFDGDFFENSTIKIVVDSSYYWHVYKDNVLVYEPNRPLMFSNATFLIGSGQNSINNAVIEGLRIL